MCFISGHVLTWTPQHRGHKRRECAASECSLLCNDFLQLGYGRMLVDPGVRQVRAEPVQLDFLSKSLEECTDTPPSPSKLPCCPLANHMKLVEPHIGL